MAQYGTIGLAGCRSGSPSARWPRDGLQNESAVLPTKVKWSSSSAWWRPAHTVVESTSFVHPKWVPQLADAEDVLTGCAASGRALPVLVPNERGLTAR